MKELRLFVREPLIAGSDPTRIKRARIVYKENVDLTSKTREISRKRERKKNENKRQLFWDYGSFGSSFK
jgi:hypothetical protein